MTAEQWLIFVLFPLAAYVLGATPFGVLLARSQGVDLRARGSGNVGATNVGRILGRRGGYLCFLLDTAKGLAPVLAMGLYVRRDGVLATGEQLAWLGVAFGAIAGHVFSFYLKFRGGKGVATSLGVLLGFWPYFTIGGAGALALWVAVTLKWRMVSLGSIVAAVAFPLLFLATCLVAGWPIGDILPLLIFAVAMAGLIVFRHRANLARLLRGQENKIGQRAPKP